MSESSLRPSMCKRILFCTDFSPNADLAFDFAIDAAVRRPDCTLILLHVIPEPDAQFWKTYLYEVDDVDAKAKADIDAKVAEAYLSRVPEGVHVEVEMRIGKDYLKILEVAKEKDVDLIVIGRQGRSALEDVLYGNVTVKVARKAECPILIVPMEYQERATPQPADLS